MPNDVLPASSSTNQEHAPASPQISSFWFDDGSVIIAVARERFRLHRSLLSRHSPVLESLPVSQSAGTGTNDVPIVEIPEGLTNTKDFTALLEHLYHDVYVLLLAHVYLTISPSAPLLLRPITSPRLFKASRLCSTTCSVVLATCDVRKVSQVPRHPRPCSRTVSHAPGGETRRRELCYTR